MGFASSSTPLGTRQDLVWACGQEEVGKAAIVQALRSLRNVMGVCLVTNYT